MAALFEARERAYEAKWAHDEEMRFRMVARRNELVGRWAAAEMGLSPAEIDRYVAAITLMGMKSGDWGPLFQKIRSDLGPGHSDLTILRKMDDFLRAASLDIGF
jgi:hypothetical protein